MRGKYLVIVMQQMAKPLSCLIFQISFCISNSFQKGLYYWKSIKHLAEIGVTEILEMTSQGNDFLVNWIVEVVLEMLGLISCPSLRV